MSTSFEPSMTDDALPVVVVLGDFAHEGLSAKIESLGFSVLNRRFRSSPRNWESITRLLRQLNDDGRLVLVFGYIPTPTLLLVASEQFDTVRPALFTELERTTTVFFVFEDNLQGTVNPFPWEVDDDYDGTPLEADEVPWRTVENHDRDEWLEDHEESIARAMATLQDWSRRKISVLPFRKRSDVTIRMFEALEDAQSGVFLRLYVPNGRYQSEQFEDFLTLFTRYLREVEGKDFTVDVQRTARGTTYVFRGRGDARTVEDLRLATSRFDDFLVLTQTDPQAAERILVSAGASQADVGFIVAKYARSFRRLHLEIRHEFERRRLLLVQQMEAEVLDVSDGTLLPLPAEQHPSTLFAVIGNTAPVTINLASAAAGSQATLQKVVSGGINYTEEDRAILARIADLEDEVQALQLRSDLERLKDPVTSPDERRTAVQKLKGFLYSSARSLGKKADEIGTKVLVSYLQSLIPKPPS